MFGISFIKVQPVTYLLQYQNGRVRREGAGLAFWFYSPSSSIVTIPIGSSDAPFIFTEISADFQEVTIQGQVTYRVADPKKLAGLLNYTWDVNFRRYSSDDPTKMPQRIMNLVQVLTKAEIQKLKMREAIRSSQTLFDSLLAGLKSAPEMEALGVEILGLSILAIKPTPESARALETEAREELLREADESTYRRRNASIAQERSVKENELATDLAVELKKRAIREAEIDSERAVLDKKNELQTAELEAKTLREEKNRALVALVSENARAEADTRAYGISAVTKAFVGLDPKVLHSLAMNGMNPDQIIATAFQELAENAEKIGELNISPDLLGHLLSKRGKDR